MASYYIPEFPLPLGYRFCPTDEELITYYLAKKVFKQPDMPPNNIQEVNLYDYSPQELHEIYGAPNDNELYVWTQRKPRYPNGVKTSRTARKGFWKATMTEKKIMDENGYIIGYKNALEFREGKGKKTIWLMYEYIATQNCASDNPQVNPKKIDEWVLCKVYVSRRNYKNLQTSSAKSEETNHQNSKYLQGGPSNNILKNVNGPPENQFEAHDMPYQISSNLSHDQVQYYPNYMESTQVSDQILKETIHQNLGETHQTPASYLQARPSNNIFNVSGPRHDQNQLKTRVQNQIPIGVYAHQCPNSVEYTNSSANDHAYAQNMDQYLRAGSSINIYNSDALSNTDYDYLVQDYPSYSKYTQLSYQDSEETSHQNLVDLDHVPNQILLNTDHNGHIQNYTSYEDHEDLKELDQLMSTEVVIRLID
ncbi:NAC domain containing protein [Parasponia andersonii]|uniref:NAC domain containing protein n=1 Tax=Parasponia andersonii TaxID=3476 RepID=A0A2P5BTW3_PARAD|nr:NAC domain containing protein [Parasponia andersonii]